MAERSGPAAAILVICAMALVALPALAASPETARHHCAPVVDAKLIELGIERSRLSDIVYGRQSTSGETDRIIAINAWISLKDCDGAVIIEMRPTCEFQQAYSIRSCKIAGLYHSC